MSKPLDAILDLASVGSPLTCTLSPESVQVIFYALSFISDVKAWKEGFFDVVTDAEWSDIIELLADVEQELLP